MGMYCNEKEGDRLVEGLKGCTACIHHDKDTMEVWCEEYEQFYGFLPATATPEVIHAAVGFFRNGQMIGEKIGEETIQATMRRAMGCTY